MSTENQNPSKTAQTVAITSLVLAVIALGIAVVLAISILRKSYSSRPTTVIPFPPSRPQSLSSSQPVTNPESLQFSSRVPTAPKLSPNNKDQDDDKGDNNNVDDY